MIKKSFVLVAADVWNFPTRQLQNATVTVYDAALPTGQIIAINTTGIFTFSKPSGLDVSLEIEVGGTGTWHNIAFTNTHTYTFVCAADEQYRIRNTGASAPVLVTRVRF